MVSPEIKIKTLNGIFCCTLFFLFDCEAAKEANCETSGTLDGEIFAAEVVLLLDIEGLRLLNRWRSFIEIFKKNFFIKI
jgi:hypothetical protein